jgi:ubiquinone/menaquinone biosynthesis C-methylase UbiE
MLDRDPYTEYRRARFAAHAGRDAVWRAVVDHLSPRWIPADATVLDLGCGYGDFIGNVTARRRIAVDIADFEPLDDVEFHRSSVTDLGFLGDATVDIVFASNLLEHLDRDAVSACLFEVRRVLSANGRIILIQPNFRLCYDRYFDDYTHVTVFTDESIGGWLRASGFSVEYLRAGFLPFSMRSRLPKSYALTRLHLALGSPLFGKQMLVVARKEA